METLYLNVHPFGNRYPEWMASLSLDRGQDSNPCTSSSLHFNSSIPFSFYFSSYPLTLHFRLSILFILFSWPSYPLTLHFHLPILFFILFSWPSYPLILHFHPPIPLILHFRLSYPFLFYFLGLPSYNSLFSSPYPSNP